MDFYPRLRLQLIDLEGYEHEAYPDPLTKSDPWTIGIGHTGKEVHEGLVWSDVEIDAAYDVDVKIAESACTRNFPWYKGLDDARRAVILGMCFQMGYGRLMGFKHMLAASATRMWPTAALEMHDSAWAKQTPKRVARLAQQLETGEWQ